MSSCDPPPQKKTRVVEKRKRITEPCDQLIFKSTHRANGLFLLSNFFGGAEFDYMLPKFKDGPIRELLVSWKSIATEDELNTVRHQLSCERVVLAVGGKRRLEPKGGKSGAPYTDAQRRSYVAKHGGTTHLGSGILAKLAANSWRDQTRMNVMEFLAGMKHDSMTPPKDIYKPGDPECVARRKTNMKAAVKNKYESGPFRSYLLETGEAELGEQGGGDFGIKGKNLLGKWLMERRKKLREEDDLSKN
jgi:hypothetical protein